MYNKKYRVLRSVIVVAMGTLLTACTHQFITQMPLLRHHSTIVWEDRQFNKYPFRYYLGEYYTPSKHIDCQYRCRSTKSMYRYVVISAMDTIEFEFSKAYIPTNTDSINIIINWATDSSCINMMSSSMWRGGILSAYAGSMYCSIKSTKPVFVEVYVVVNTMRKNKNKTIYELIEEDRRNKIDSLVRNIR